MQPDQLIRLECLKLAAAQTAGPADTCAKAQAYTDFVRGVDNVARQEASLGRGEGTAPPSSLATAPAQAQPEEPQNKARSAGARR